MLTATIIGGICAGLAAIGVVYQLIARAALIRFFAHRPQPEPQSVPVTLLKPLYGNEPELFENLATFLRQNHAGPVQMICGVASAADPAVVVVRALQQAFPDAHIDLVINPQRHGANGKINNVINMMAMAQHDVLILSDSDMAVGPDYLAIVLNALDQPGTGAVSCLYQGRGLECDDKKWEPVFVIESHGHQELERDFDSIKNHLALGGFWSQMSAGVIHHNALPDMIMGIVTGIEQPCMGSTIALRREVLERVGGFARFADVLADDHALGAAVRGLGLRIAIPPMLLSHDCPEENFMAFWRQKLRWAVTIRDINFWGYLGSIVTRPLPLALLTMLFLPSLGLILIVAALMARFAVQIAVNRIMNPPYQPAYLLPVIDCIEFAVYVASFTVHFVNWRGDTLRVANKGRISAEGSD